MTVIVVLTAVVVLFSCKEFVLCLVIFSTTQKLDDNHRIVGMHSISIRTSADADNHKTKYPVYSTSSSTSNGNDFKIYSSFFYRSSKSAMFGGGCPQSGSLEPANDATGKQKRAMESSPSRAIV